MVEAYGVLWCCLRCAGFLLRNTNKELIMFSRNFITDLSWNS